MATSKRTTDFVSGLQERSSSREKKPSLSLCYRSAFFQRRIDDSGVITHSPSRVRSAAVEKQSFREDGFYSISDNPLTSRVVKPYPLESQISFRSEDEGVAVGKAYGKLLEIAVRDVVVRDEEGTALQVASVALLFRGKVICRTSQPFNRKLHKFFVRNALDSSNFSMQVQSQGGAASGLLPLPLPERRAKQRRMEIDFSMSDATGRPRSGLVVCTVSLSIMGSDPERPEPSTYLYTPSASDPNDPRNCYSLAQLRRDRHQSARQARYFLLHDPALCLATALPPSRPGERQEAIKRRLQAEKPDTVVAEQMFSLLDISVRSWFQERRPLRPSSRSSAIPKPHHAGRYRQVFTVTILRGVEVPLREESALVQPIVEVEWADMLRCTTTSDGPAPVWQQTLQFEIPTSKPMSSYEPCVQLRLFDQHPVWGLQWLGEARVPLESDQGSLQQFERWIGLSSLYSPSVSFGYVQASPGHWHTRIYVLMKLEQVGTLGTREIDTSSVDALCKAIQRCLVVPYRLAEVEGPDDAANLVMLLAPLPVHYGPLTPRQALNLNKVDHYGRSALLAALLAALGLQSYVLLGSSQTRKWASYALTIAENADATLWDAENGEHYDLQDNRCSLISVSRIINHHNIWENSQKSLAPVNMRYDPKVSKDWQLLFTNAPAGGSRSVQAVDLNLAPAREDAETDVTAEIEENLRQSLSQWRTTLGLPTIFNRHADSILRETLDKVEDSPSTAEEPLFDKKELRQLYRAYYTHGFVVRVRYTDLEDLAGFLLSTKIHAMSGPIEFALVCHVKKLVGKIRSVWLAVVVLRNRT